MEEPMEYKVDLDNLTVEVQGNKLILTVHDLTRFIETSRSGKSDIIASTFGPVYLPGSKVGINLTVYSVRGGKR
jgi:hypothetical protein